MNELKVDVILVPVDFSEYTGAVVKYASFLADKLGSSIRLLHVIQLLHISEAVNWMDTVMPTAAEGGLSKQIIESSQKQLDKLKEDCRQNGIEAETSVVEGVPFIEIVNAVEECDADMVVMGSHGRTGVSHLLMGSVAEKVVRRASCPVLCIKPEGFKWEMPEEK